MEEKRSRVLRALKHAPLHAKDFQYTDSVSSRVWMELQHGSLIQGT